MRQETVTRDILTFAELNDKQKAKVIDNLRDINVDHDWHDSVFEDTTTILTMLGFTNVDIRFSGFAHQGDGASFTGTFSVPKTKKEAKERLSKVKEYAPKVKLYDFVDMRFNKEEKEAETLLVGRLDSRYSHANTVSSDNGDLTHFVRDFSNYIYKSLWDEYDYLTSDEAIKETIEANEYEFYADMLKIV
jgi:hypothetical protein